jgi:hypothetical protein
VIYVACSSGMQALALNTANDTFATLPGWTVNPNAIAPPIEAGGRIWSAGYNDGVLYALDPSNGTTTFSSSLGGFEHFNSPSAAGGRLFIANQSGSGTDQITAFQIAHAPPPTPTSETLSSSANPAAVGQTVSLTATISPTPDAGTIAFTDGGAAIPGCGAIAVNPMTPLATCTTSFGTAGQHPILASYSGDAYYVGASASLSQVVAATGPGGPGGPPTIVPVISKLHARALHRKLQLKLVLSTPAKLTIVLSRNLAGRIVHRRCRAGAKRGRRCTVVRKVTFTISATQGANTLRPRMRALARGPYTVTVTGVSASGGRSRRYTVTFVVPRS